MSLADVARRVVAERERGNAEFRAVDAFELTGGILRERDAATSGDL